MTFCLQEDLRNGGLVFQQVQVLEDELTEEKSWGHRRDRGKLIFRPSGIVVGKFLRLTYDPNLPGEAHRSGWRARYRVLPCGDLQIYDFVDLRPEEADFRDMPVSKKDWVAVKELNLSYYIGETFLFTIYTHYGNLIQVP